MLEKEHHTTYMRVAIILLLVVFAVIIYFPQASSDILENVEFASIKEVLLFIPAFFILFGLLDVLLPKEKVVKHLGKVSGIKGNITAYLLGALLPGPVYLAFPMATQLLKKGSSTFNVTLFISAWASFNLTEEIFEINFLGWRFFLLRLAITVPLVIVLAFLTDRFTKPKDVQD